MFYQTGHKFLGKPTHCPGEGWRGICDSLKDTKACTARGSTFFGFDFITSCMWMARHNHKIVHELCMSQQILYLGLYVHFSQILILSALALLHQHSLATSSLSPLSGSCDFLWRIKSILRIKLLPNFVQEWEFSFSLRGAWLTDPEPCWPRWICNYYKSLNQIAKECDQLDISSTFRVA